ncbi:ribosome biogenesis protein Nop16 [Lipomyces arxii]|uniref:ribosome biogenesis protein Nop16 n=1 Tax=Lipomyces arxii TaxID=56418 RepID=UPI0034CF3DF2
MVSVRRRRKQKSGTPKVTRRLKDKQRKVRIKSNAIIAANWDEKLTLTQNYKKLGLTSRLSRPSGGVQKDLTGAETPKKALQTENIGSRGLSEARIFRDPETGEVQRIEHVVRTEFDNLEPVFESDTGSEATEVIKQLEEFAARGEKTAPRTQSEREGAWVGDLIAKHGDDYERMARDQKLNIWQQSVGDIRRRVEKWKKKNGK